MLQDDYDPYQEYADAYGLDEDNEEHREIIWLLSEQETHDLAAEHGIEI